MRNLTIERRKSFVACTGKLKVYIEDPAGELSINGAPCRKLGEVKNGQTATFPIGEESGRLYGIFDKLSRDYCNDFYNIPAGTEDISVAGQCKFNPAAGNAFRFDGSDNTEEGMSHHKRSNRKGLIFLFAFVIVGTIVGFFVGRGLANHFSGADDPASAQPKTFSSQGMQITLNEDFSKDVLDSFTACYSSNDAAVLALKEEFTLMAGLENYTLEQYGQLVLQTNGMTDFQLQTQDGITFFEYESETDQGTFYYLSTLHKGPDAFWMVQFACDVADADDYVPYFLEWAKSISFAA